MMWFALGFLLLASATCSVNFFIDWDHREFRSNVNALAQFVSDSEAVAALDMTLEHSPALIEKVEEDASLEPCLAPLVGALYPKLSVLPTSSFRGKDFNSVAALIKVVFLGFDANFGSIQRLDRLVEEYGRCYALFNEMRRFLYLHKPRTTFSFPASLTKAIVAVSKPDIFSFLTIYWGHIIRAMVQAIKKKKVVRFQAEHIRFVMSLALECQQSGSILEQLLSEIEKENSIMLQIWNFLDSSAFIQHIPELILANSSNPKLLFKFCVFVLDAKSIQHFFNVESFDTAVKLFAGRQPFALADVLSFYKDNRLVYDRLTNLCRSNLRQIAAARIVHSKMDSINAAVGTLQLNGFRTIRELKTIFDDLTVLDKANLGEIEEYSAILLDKPLKSVYERLIYIDPFEAEESQILIHRIRMVLALIKIKFRHFTPHGVDAAVAGAVSSYYSATLLFTRDLELQTLRRRFEEHRTLCFQVMIEYLQTGVPELFPVDSLLPMVLYFNFSRDQQGEDYAQRFALEILKKKNLPEFHFPIEQAENKNILPQGSFQQILTEYFTGDTPLNAKLKILSEAKRHNWLSSTAIDFLTLFLK